MANESQKQAIRRRINISRFPRRRNADYTSDSNHNPMVLQECPECHGSGTYGKHFTDHDGNHVRALCKCEACNGSGITGNVEPCFSNDNPEKEADVRLSGWLTCPNCGKRFTTNGKHSWTGRRHITCGQLIKLKQIPES